VEDGSHRQLTRYGLPLWGLGGRITSPYHNKPACYKKLHRVSDLEPMEGSCKYGSESLGSIKGSEFLDFISQEGLHGICL
jgi:hypothetical protein